MHADLITKHPDFSQFHNWGIPRVPQDVEQINLEWDFWCSFVHRKNWNMQRKKKNNTNPPRLNVVCWKQGNEQGEHPG